MIARVVSAPALLLLKKLLSQTWRLIMKHGNQRVVGLFCYFCSHKSCTLSKRTINLPLRLKSLRKKGEGESPLAISSKNLVANAKFLVALATSESQFRALSLKLVCFKVANI